MTISSPVIGPVTVVGNTSGGTDYNYEIWKEGKAIRKIAVWESGNRMKAVKFWKSGEADNQGTVYGSASGTMSTYTFEAGELITSMSLWPGQWNYVGDRAGRIMFTTSLGNTFAHGYSGGGGEKVINVYSGILVGANVRAGDDLNSWGFAFLRPLVACQLRNVTYNVLSGGINLESLDSLHTNVAGNWSFSGSKKKTVSSSWSKTEGVTTTIGFSVSSGFPGIFEVEDKFEWQMSTSYTMEESTEIETTLTWSMSGRLESGESLSLQALVHSGSISVPYSGTMYVTVDTGASYTYPQSGTYTGVSVTAVQIPVTKYLEDPVYPVIPSNPTFSEKMIINP